MLYHKSGLLDKVWHYYNFELENVCLKSVKYKIEKEAKLKPIIP